MNKEDKRTFIRLRELDKDCRCCGHGREKVCDKCYKLLQEGYAVLVEITDASTMERKKTTGYNVAVLADGRYVDMGDPSREPLQPNTIYFIRQSDLKAFLKDEYNHPKTGTGHRPASKFLSRAPRSAHRQPERSSRSAAELLHT